MRIFDGLCAWFAPNVPSAHINTWLADGGIHIRDVNKGIVQYYFSNNIDDEETQELTREREKVVYRSSWITESSVSRTKQPLGAYALLQNNSSSTIMSPANNGRWSWMTPGGVSDRWRNPGTQSARMPRRVGHGKSPSSGGGYDTRRTYSVAGDHVYGGSPYSHQKPLPLDREHSLGHDNRSETQSVRSRSSRHSNASSIVSAYGRGHHAVNRFLIRADANTRKLVVANVNDFVPNKDGFIAYKIPRIK